MITGSGVSKSTPESVAPTWKVAPPGTWPEAPPDHAWPVDHSSWYRLSVWPLNTRVPSGPEIVGVPHGDAIARVGPGHDRRRVAGSGTPSGAGARSGRSG